MRIQRIINGRVYYFGQFKRGIEWVFGWVVSALKAITYRTVEGFKRVACQLDSGNHCFAWR